MSEARVLSYFPSPRLSKATIAARLCDVEIEIRGDSGDAMKDWLWDFEARPLIPGERETFARYARGARTGFSGDILFKTDAFLKAHPFGAVPAAFSPDGRIGIFESNSILRLVARIGENTLPLYGANVYEASRIDSFLDVSLAFANEVQFYLLALRTGSLTHADHARVSNIFAVYMDGINRALVTGGLYIASSSLSIADVCFACELALLSGENRFIEQLSDIGCDVILSARNCESFPHSFSHFERLLDHPAFAPDLGPYVNQFGSIWASKC